MIALSIRFLAFGTVPLRNGVAEIACQCNVGDDFEIKWADRAGLQDRAEFSVTLTPQGFRVQHIAWTRNVARHGTSDEMISYVVRRPP